MKTKTIQITFKNGAQITVPYSSKVYTDLVDKMGKDAKVEAAAGYAVMTKEVIAVVYIVTEA